MALEPFPKIPVRIAVRTDVGDEKQGKRLDFRPATEVLALRLKMPVERKLDHAVLIGPQMRPRRDRIVHLADESVRERGKTSLCCC